MTDKTYLWSHEPFLSGRPIKRLHRDIKILKETDIDERAVFMLENNKFLFIRFYGTKKDLKLGYTDIKEFDNLESAVRMYEEYKCEI